MEYNFEWDLAKAVENSRKHKVSFERATEVFADPIAISVFDEQHSSGEDRWATMGTDRNGIVLVVIHTVREAGAEHCNIRLISARKATKHETKQYRSQ